MSATIAAATSTAAIAAATAPASFTLDEDVILGDTVLIPAGTNIIVRKPDSGALRGLKLLDLHQMDVVSLEVLAPRITTPVIVKGSKIGPADLMQLGAEVMDFLLPRAAKPTVFPAA